jgi:hypothetical protein
MRHKEISPLVAELKHNYIKSITKKLLNNKIFNLKKHKLGVKM